MTPELHTAIEQVYAAFSDVSKPEIIEGCPCCLERKGVDVLLTKSLKAISPDELSNYAACAFTTVGNLADFLYLLPRILEISAMHPEWWPNIELVAQKLKAGQFKIWSENHKRAVLHYFDAVFEAILNVENAGWLIDSWICAWGHLFEDVSPYLARLEGYPTQVISYFEINSESLLKGRLSNSFWEDDLHAYAQVQNWFNSPEIKNIIKMGYGL